MKNKLLTLACLPIPFTRNNIEVVTIQTLHIPYGFIILFTTIDVTEQPQEFQQTTRGAVERVTRGRDGE